MSVLGLIFGGVVATATVGGAAPAVSSTQVAAPVASAARADVRVRSDQLFPRYDPWNQPYDGTGYVSPGGHASIGLWDTSYSVFDYLSLSTNTMVWAIGPILQGLVGNLHVKGAFPVSSDVWLSAEVGAYIFDVKDKDPEDGSIQRRVQGLALPFTVAGSWRVDDTQTYSLAVRYTAAEGNGSTQNDGSSTEVDVAITDGFATLLTGQWRLSRMISIYARAQIQVYQLPLGVQGRTQVTATDTTITYEGTVNPESGVLGSGLAGIHFRWGQANLRVGGGYGHLFVPRMGLVYFNPIPFPDLDFYVRF